MAPTASPILTAGKAALADIEKRRPGLGSQTLQDYINAGFRIDASVAADLAAVRAINGTDYARIRTMFDHPSLVQQDALNGVGVGAVGDTVSRTGTIVGQAPYQMTKPIGEGLNSALSPLGGIASVVSALAQPATWLRIGESVLGIVLIAVGIVAITKSTPIGTSVQNGVQKVAKVIP